MLQVWFLVGVGALVVIGNLPGAIYVTLFRFKSFDEFLYDVVSMLCHIRGRGVSQERTTASTSAVPAGGLL